jgi:DNA-binding transcriptional MerR regulator
MRISNLSRQSGVSVATVKFYLREQLLPPGVATARNQAEYDETHLERLRLIKVLTGVGMMSLAAVREVLAAVDSNCLSPHDLARVVNRALAAEQPVGGADPGTLASASVSVDGFLDRVGWSIEADAPGRVTLVKVLAALGSLGWPCDAAIFTPYVDTAERLAVHELDTVPADSAAAAVARIVLFEVAFAVLRRMAYEHYLAIRAVSQPVS